jgi:hypothetical protein
MDSIETIVGKFKDSHKLCMLLHPDPNDWQRVKDEYGPIIRAASKSVGGRTLEGVMSILGTLKDRGRETGEDMAGTASRVLGVAYEMIADDNQD